jgi:hypothetical protein
MQGGAAIGFLLSISGAKAAYERSFSGPLPEKRKIGT